MRSLKRLAAMTAIALFVLCLGLAVPVQAEAGDAEMDYSVGGAVGYFAPFDDDFDGGFNGKADFEMYRWDPMALRLTVGMMDGSVDAPGTPSVDIFYGTANVVYAFEARQVMPYVTFGLGLYNVDVDVKDVGSSTEFGANGGAGVEYPLSEGINVYLEALLHVIAGEGPSISGCGDRSF